MCGMCSVEAAVSASIGCSETWIHRKLYNYMTLTPPPQSAYTNRNYIVIDSMLSPFLQLLAHRQNKPYMPTRNKSCKCGTPRLFSLFLTFVIESQEVGCSRELKLNCSQIDLIFTNSASKVAMMACERLDDAITAVDDPFITSLQKKFQYYHCFHH